MSETGKGFSLPELLVVLAISASALAITAPRLQSALQSYTLKQHSSELATLLRNARSKAMREGKSTQIEFDLDARTYQMLGANKQHAVAEEIDIALTLARVQDTRLQIRFRPDGSASGGDIDLSNRQLMHRVSVSWLTGRTTVKAVSKGE